MSPFNYYEVPPSRLPKSIPQPGVPDGEESEKVEVADPDFLSVQKVFFRSSNAIIKIWTQNGPISHLVSADVLSLASDPWRCGLDPNATKPPTTIQINGRGHTEIDLEEEDEESIEIVLNAIHLRTHHVPESISFNTLKNVALVCTKYFCGEAVMPWARFWLEQHVNSSGEIGNEDWLFISKRLSPIFIGLPELSRGLIKLVSTKSECGTYLIRFSEGSGDEHHQMPLRHIPDDIIDFIAKERERVVLLLSNLLGDLVNDIEFHDLGSTSLQRGSGPFETVCDVEECLDGAYGSLMRQLKLLGLYPLVCKADPVHWRGPMNGLLAKIESIRMRTLIPKPIAIAQPGGFVQHPAYGRGGLFGAGVIRSADSQPEVTILATDAPQIQMAFSSQDDDTRNAKAIEYIEFIAPAFDRERYKDIRSSFAINTSWSC